MYFDANFSIDPGAAFFAYCKALFDENKKTRSEIFFTGAEIWKKFSFEIYELASVRNKNGDEEVDAMKRNTCKRLWLKHSLAMSSFAKPAAKTSF